MPEGARPSTTLYDRDFYAWAVDQAERLRDLARRGSDPGLDLENLAEEVDGLARSDRDAVLSQVARIMTHFLKLEFSPSDRPRAGWEASLIEARQQLHRKLTPSLRRIAIEELAAEYRGARKLAAAELKAHREETHARGFPDECPYTLEQILDEDWLPSSGSRQLTTPR